MKERLPVNIHDKKAKPLYTSKDQAMLWNLMHIESFARMICLKVLHVELL